MHWNNRLLSGREWSGRNAVPLSAGVNGIYLSRANLDVAFDDSGRQINPLIARLSGNVAGVMKLFNRCGWHAEPESGTTLPHQFTLMARLGSPGKNELRKTHYNYTPDLTSNICTSNINVAFPGIVGGTPSNPNASSGGNTIFIRPPLPINVNPRVSAGNTESALIF